MDGFDLRKYQGGEEHDEIKTIMGKILSGREGYQAVIETKKEELKCPNCDWHLEGGEKFCPECGAKTTQPVQQEPATEQPQEVKATQESQNLTPPTSE